MSAPARFDASVLHVLREIEEVEILTRRAAGEPRRTIIWVMVDDSGRALIRSVRGPRGRWWQEAVADPRVSFDLDGQEIPATAVPADDADRVAATNRELRRKYALHGGSLVAMLRPDTLPTTLELIPRA